MTAHTPLYASDKTAAKLLDMTRPEFLDLVDQGALPPPVMLGTNLARWSVRDLETIINGRAAIPEQDIE